MDWNIQELETLCESKGLLSPKLFVQTLLHQKRRVIYHADESIKIMEHYHKDYGPVIDLNSEIHMQALGEAEFRSICHAEACLQTMHAMANILSQVVNITLVIDLSLINGYISQKKRVDLCKHPLSSCCDRATLRMAFRTRSAS